MSKSAATRQIQAGDALPKREFNVTNVELFLYNAALWNAHRIHFDLPYSKDVEGYPGLVIAGPQMGDWLTQCVVEWMGDEGVLKVIEYRNLRAAIVGDKLYVGGTVTAWDAAMGLASVELFVKNQQDEFILSGQAQVRFPTH
jgi:3-methylfumaryl-CoA hydratase